ncbi:MAG: beta-galactosidase [Dysgonamonadaceae bacterium]|jgi:beta-galactosidase|nr:beta-galactosidase [Dysgonamonadaceae bacterium]
MKRIQTTLLWLISAAAVSAQGVVFDGDFSPAEGLTTPQEKPFRDEICLNGYWDIQAIPAPQGWKQGETPTPELPSSAAGKWEEVQIKIPSAVNVNDWGRGAKTGAGTDQPYAPSSVYFPSYPEKWIHARMAWLRKSFTLPEAWNGKRIYLHFEAVAGESTVYINGKEAGKNFDSHLPFELDVTDYVLPNGRNEILVGLRHSKLFDKNHPQYSKFGATYPTGSNTDDLLGIWQDVFLLAVPDVHIADVFVKPLVDKNVLEIEVELKNQSGKKQKISLSGEVKEWINRADFSHPLSAAEIAWNLGNTALQIPAGKNIELAAGETRTVLLQKAVTGELNYWSPAQPNLYNLLLNINGKKQTLDCKSTRFGWRQLKIVGDEFQLNGEKIQCFGDIQHPFSAYICSRRFAYAWYKMIQDFGGNAVRPHAQPWPRVYYDLADEMGLMVLDETALFGSSIRLNLEEEITWQRSQEHLNRLILRDRNHPSVIGWSAGNEMFAIALLNKPPKEVSDKWDNRLVELTLSAKQLDPTRDFITLDGDRDMDGRLPVWSKHFGHGLRTEDLPQNLNKPLVVGEFSATYYGKPSQLYPFVGDKAFESYYGRNEALAVDVYQNAVQMARPFLAYFSPSEVSWFGIEHLNLGYHDFSRLPNLSDGIFAGKPYEEGKPGYQYERIPPYVTTFNPGLDPQLPLYKPLPMFEALKAALSESEPQACRWDTYRECIAPKPPEFLPVKYVSATFIGNENGLLYKQLKQLGIDFQLEADLLIIEAETVNQQQLEKAGKIRKNGGFIWIMFAEKTDNPALKTLIPFPWTLTDRKATALETNTSTDWGKYFDLPHLYFAEMEGDKQILKCGLGGEIVEKAEVVLIASRTDWSLFNQQPENKKCAQIVLYEQLEKPSGTALIRIPLDKATLVISTLDYRIQNKETETFWKTLFASMQIDLSNSAAKKEDASKKNHDLLLDGPVD